MLSLPSTAHYVNAPNDMHFSLQAPHRNAPNYNNQVSATEANF